MKSGGIAPLFFISAPGGSGHLDAVAALPPGKEPMAPIECEAGWAPKPVWTLWRRKQPLAAGKNRTPVVRLVGRRCTD
jgi:hypothetical protein